MTPDPMYAVWTRNDSEEWKKKNRGDTNALITHGVPLERAKRVLNVLQSTYGDLHAEIHPTATPPKTSSVGDEQAEIRTMAVAAEGQGFSRLSLRDILDTYRQERLRTIEERRRRDST